MSPGNTATRGVGESLEEALGQLFPELSIGIEQKGKPEDFRQGKERTGIQREM